MTSSKTVDIFVDYGNEKAAFDESDENEMDVVDDVGGHSS